MTVAIYRSNKFYHSDEQYFAVVGGHTLLRLTCGGLWNQPGGVIMSATASDLGAPPVFADRGRLIDAMCRGVQMLGGRADHVRIRHDSKYRHFAEITLAGASDVLLKAMHGLADTMGKLLETPARSIRRQGYVEVRGMHHALCHAKDEAACLSDTVFLERDEELVV